MEPLFCLHHVHTILHSHPEVQKSFNFSVSLGNFCSSDGASWWYHTVVLICLFITIIIIKELFICPLYIFFEEMFNSCLAHCFGLSSGLGPRRPGEKQNGVTYTKVLHQAESKLFICSSEKLRFREITAKGSNGHDNELPLVLSFSPPTKKQPKGNLM